MSILHDIYGGSALGADLGLAIASVGWLLWGIAGIAIKKPTVQKVLHKWAKWILITGGSVIIGSLIVLAITFFLLGAYH